MGACASNLRGKHPKRAETPGQPDTSQQYPDSPTNLANELNNSTTTSPELPSGNETQGIGMKFLNGGYWPSWKVYDGLFPSCVDISMITHVNYAFANIDGDGTIYLEDEAAHYQMAVDGTYGGLRAWTQQKIEYPGLKVILSIGGGHQSAADIFVDIAAHPGKTARLVESAKQLLQDFNLDGIDIDWEHPVTEGQANQYLNLMMALRRELPASYLVTTALPSNEDVLQLIPLQHLADHIDYLNLMAYDFVGPDFANVVLTGHHAQLYKSESQSPSGASAVDYLIKQGVPPSKVILGIPTYGRSFAGAGGPHQKFSGAGKYKAEYEVKELPRPGMEEFYDSDAVAVFAVGNGEYITYDNKHSVARKAQFAKNKKLGGLFYWHLGGDRCKDESLIAAGHKVLSENVAE